MATPPKEGANTSLLEVTAGPPSASWLFEAKRRNPAVAPPCYAACAAYGNEMRRWSTGRWSDGWVADAGCRNGVGSMVRNGHCCAGKGPRRRFDGRDDRRPRK